MQHMQHDHAAHMLHEAYLYAKCCMLHAASLPITSKSDHPRELSTGVSTCGTLSNTKVRFIMLHVAVLDILIQNNETYKHYK
jgi:hypothetical protein